MKCQWEVNAVSWTSTRGQWEVKNQVDHTLTDVNERAVNAVSINPGAAKSHHPSITLVIVYILYLCSL